MKALRPFKFSFKSEPIWMLVFSLGLAVLGLLIWFIVLIAKSFR